MIEAIVLAGAMFGLFVFVHIAYFRVFLPTDRWKTVQRFAILFLFIYVGLYYALPESNWFGILSATSGLPQFIACANGAFLYVFFFLTYGQVYFLIDRGVSARMMIELLANGERGLSQEEIASRYSPVALERRRLDDMVYGQYIICTNGEYRLTTKGRYMGRVFVLLKHLLHLYPGG